MAKIVSTEAAFTTIFKYKLWGNEESISGPGSGLKYTENLRKELAKLIKEYSIGTIFDAPCGDFYWMKHVLREAPADYIGGDIVKPLIAQLNTQHKNARTKFVHMDIIHDDFPKADLMICRDCMPHLTFGQARDMLDNFMASGIAYFLATTHHNSDGSPNKDIEAAGFRLIDLFAAPYCFPANPLVRIEDWIAPHPRREMCLWNREQVGEALAAFKPA